jgi:hypothetical protein
VVSRHKEENIRKQSFQEGCLELDERDGDDGFGRFFSGVYSRVVRARGVIPIFNYLLEDLMKDRDVFKQLGRRYRFSDAVFDDNWR